MSIVCPKCEQFALFRLQARGNFTTLEGVFLQEKCSWEIQMNREKKEELKRAQQQQGGHHQQDGGQQQQGGQKTREGQQQQGSDPGKSGQPTRHQFRPDDTD